MITPSRLNPQCRTHTCSDCSCIAHLSLPIWLRGGMSLPRVLATSPPTGKLDDSGLHPVVAGLRKWALAASAASVAETVTLPLDVTKTRCVFRSKYAHALPHVVTVLLLFHAPCRTQTSTAKRTGPVSVSRPQATGHVRHSGWHFQARGAPCIVQWSSCGHHSSSSVWWHRPRVLPASEVRLEAFVCAQRCAVRSRLAVPGTW